MTTPDPRGPGPDLWRRLDAALDQLLDLSAIERADALARLTRDDPELRPHLERLLRADARDDGVLEADAARLAGPMEHDDDPPPDAAGPYRILHELGRGGMGAVYLARRDDGHFDQTVAVKVIKRGMDTAAVTGRFLRERQILAHLQHPGIARLLDGGVTGDGRPYFVMEHVDGRPLTEYADAAGLDLDARLDLCEAVVDAVRYAQERLVVHRDLKPSNILVTAEGAVKLLDFGIAKLLDDDGDDGVTLTRPGQGLITPGYAAPEQIRGEPVTTATDVFALGVVMHELLTGRRPAVVTSRSRTAALRAPAEEGGPPRPLRGDLANIVAMAVREEPERRYASAAALLEDLRRFRRGRPVHARPDTAGYRLSRYLQRHRVAVSAAALVVLALAVGLAGTAWQAREAARQAARAQEVTSFLVGLFRAADPDASPGGEPTARDLLALGAARIDSLSGDPDLQLELSRLVGGLAMELGDFDGAVPHLERALTLARTRSDADAPVVRQVLNDLGGAHLERMDLQAADSLFSHARALWDRAGDPGDQAPTLARLLNDQAVLASRSDDVATAERLYREALAIDERAFGRRSLPAAVDLSNLGVLLQDIDRLDEALALHHEVLEIRRALLPPDHSQIALSLHNLADLQRRRGEPDAADPLFREAIGMRRRLYPDGHPMLAGSLNQLAKVELGRGRFAAAESLMTESLDMRRRMLGDAHSDVAGTLNDLALLAFRRGDYATAAQGFGRALEVFDRILPASHRTCIAVQNNTAGTLLRAEDLPGAAAAYLRLLERVRQADPAAPVPLGGRDFFDAGRTLRRTGHTAAAVDCLRRSLERRLADPGAGQALRGETHHELALALTDAGRTDEAAEHLRRARDAYAADDDPRADEADRLLRDLTR